jgi:hypothetical protein
LQNNRRTTVVVCAVIGALLIINTLTIVIIIWQRMENSSLRAQLSRQPSDRARPRRAPLEFLLPADPNGFAAVPETAIPGRYKWIKSGEEKGTITLNPDHSFANEKGEKFRVYQWDLTAGDLTLTWQRGPVRFTIVESPGIYVALRPNDQTERLEKVE